MKRIILIISCVAFFALQSNAQKGTNEFGLRIGPTMNWVNSASPEVQNKGAHFGFIAGVFVDHYFTDYLAVSTGVNYNVMRMNYHFTDNRSLENFLQPINIPVYRKFSGSYAEIPLKIKGSMEVYDSWRTFAEAGVGLGVKLFANGKDSYDYYGTSNPNNDYANVSDEYRLLQVGLNVGLGVVYDISSRFSVFTEVTYHHGFSNMFTRALKQQTESDIKPNFIGLEIGVMY